MSDLKIAVILGSTRPGRNGAAVAEWVMQRAAGRPGVDYELVDLADVGLPLLDEPIPAIGGRYQHDHTKAWAARIAPFDGFVFVTPEYNHSIPAALKNALDYLYAEWNDKPAAFVSYGTSRGVRAVEHLRGIVGELQMAAVRHQVSFDVLADFTDRVRFTPGPQYDAQAGLLFGTVEAWATALRGVRAR